MPVGRICAGRRRVPIPFHAFARLHIQQFRVHVNYHQGLRGGQGSTQRSRFAFKLTKWATCLKSIG